jgi:hypothetical protein
VLLRDGVRVLRAAWALAAVVVGAAALATLAFASNYWMEPAIAVVVVAGNAAPPRLVGGARRDARARGDRGERVDRARDRRGRRGGLRARAAPRGAPRARTDWGARPGDVVVADNPGGEMALDGRVVAPGLETLYLVREGHLPLSTWIGDLSRPEVTCVLEQDGLFHAVPELEQLLTARFVEVETVEDWHLYALRSH